MVSSKNDGFWPLLVYHIFAVFAMFLIDFQLILIRFKKIRAQNQFVQQAL